MHSESISTNFHLFEEKMQAAGCSTGAIRAFQRSYELFQHPESLEIPESQLQPIGPLPQFDHHASPLSIAEQTALLKQCAILKLNGGLGTSMGLEGPKSLLTVREGLTFLDLILKQLRSFHQHTRVPVPLLLMNSFSTAPATRAFLQTATLPHETVFEVMQNQIPKVDALTYQPITWPHHPILEWCPPGHGDLYLTLFESHLLTQLLAQGIRYLFISNADNLGAILDPHLLQHFIHSQAPFLMEVTKRTESDRKGGHLARNAQGWLLREFAQCPEPDRAAFQDISRHRYFNTNNIWLNLESLQVTLQETQGILPLPIIPNQKPVDPRNPLSPSVFQLETALGTAVQVFKKARVLEVSRTRFAPIKTTSDLLVLRSDAYTIDAEGQVRLSPECHGIPPLVIWGEAYRCVDALERACHQGVPSLKKCRTLQIEGMVEFGPHEVFEGDVRL